MKPYRYILIAVLLLLGLFWSLEAAEKNGNEYPNSNLIASAQWLHTHKDKKEVIIVDVRTDKYFNGGLIPGAIRLPWSTFRINDTGANLA